MILTKEELFLAQLGIDTKEEIEITYGAKIKITDLLKKYHQEKMKQHDALVKMMAQDEKEGNYEEKFYCVARNPYPNSAWNFDCDTQCKGCKNHSFPSK